jgi:hypothetical protein
MCVCVAEQPHACRATQTCAFSRGNAFSRWGGRWFCACLGCMVTLTQQKYNPISLKWRTRVLYQACTSACPNLSSTAASYVCVCCRAAACVQSNTSLCVLCGDAFSRWGGRWFCACLGCMVTLTQQKYNPISLKWRTRVLYLAQALAQT